MLFEIFENLLNFIFPRRCLKCGKVLFEDGYLCDKCVEEINFITPPYCYKCGHPISELTADGKMLCAVCAGKKRHFFRTMRSAVVYDNSDKNLILGFKFFDKTENATLLAAMLKIAGKDIFSQGADVLIPVPLHYSRLIKRKYNQSVLLADKLSKMVDIPVDRFSLVRHKKTRPQVEFSGRQRVDNVKNAFSVKHPENIKGKRIILIDDVLTTGSTIKECASVLKKAGAKSVDVLTIARTTD